MKLLSRLLIALVICLIAIPTLVSPVQAAGTFRISGGDVSADEGHVGDEVRIYGNWAGSHGSYIYIYYELFGEDEEDWYYKKIRYDEFDDVEDRYTFDYDFTIPESYSGEHEILICDDDDPDDDVDTLEFTVYPYIEIDEDDGPAGTTVKVSGKGWDEDESEVDIRFYLEDPDEDEYDDDDLYVVAATSAIEIDDDPDNQGTWKEEVAFEVPPASKGKHWVYAVGDENDDIADDNIIGAEFEITPGISIDPTSGSPGGTITISGSGFVKSESGIKVLFDGESVASGISADSDGLWDKSFEIPQAAKGEYDITAEGKKTKKADIDEISFEVVPSIALSPTQGHVGTSLTVSGGGLPAGESVTVTYDGVSKGSSLTGSDGSLSGISFEATHTQSTHTADHNVVATYDTTTVTRTFVMESDAPAKPTLSSPASGIRIGVFRKQTPTFSWSAVTDDSGVTYNLEIGTTANFAQVLISRTGLTDTSYTLAQAEALDYGTYYWRVKAIDGAQNDNGWTSAYSFKSGLLPFWAFIAIVALAAVLIAVVIYILVRRRGTFYG